jgi:hypothetical protein
MIDETLYRIVASRTIAVNSGGGAVVSTTSLSAQTYAVELVYPSEAGAPAAISSLSAAVLPVGQVLRYKCTPGQKVQAISNGASTVASLTVIELSK